MSSKVQLWLGLGSTILWIVVMVADIAQRNHWSLVAVDGVGILVGSYLIGDARKQARKAKADDETYYE